MDLSPFINFRFQQMYKNIERTCISLHIRKTISRVFSLKTKRRLHLELRNREVLSQPQPNSHKNITKYGRTHW